jgi:hypothetical protein
MSSLGSRANMGIGLLGDPNLIVKRKFRWTLQFDLCNGKTTTEDFVKTASRPNISIESTELNFLNEKNFIPGKTTFETMTVTIIDVAADSMIDYYDWIASVYDFTKVERLMGSASGDYVATGRLNMYSGGGEILEQWELQNVWPEAVNFGDLATDSSDVAEVELTLRYSGVKYFSCGRAINPCAKSLCGI